MARSASIPPAVISEAHRAAFRGALLAWYGRVRRPMPWRETDDPYRIWLSEVMLQQTRVDQARPYYERFVAAFPTVEALAEADLDAVLQRWEGLGYYARARNLHRAAREVVDRHHGHLPADYDALRALPGVGAYTAAAVASIAFGLPHGVVDGNVIRVLARVFAVEQDVTRTRTHRHLQALADALLAPEDPGSFNQAMMELGATVCTPSAPACPACPLRPVCAAREAGTQTRYPIKKKKAPVPHYDIAVGLLFDGDGRLLIQRRPEEAMLGGLWEFPGGKCEPGESPAAACRRELREELGVEVEVGTPVARVDHAYSHFRITLHAFRCRLRSGTPTPREGQPIEWVALDRLGEYAFPRANRRVLDALEAHRTRPSLFD